MNEFARQLEAVVRYARDHDELAAMVEGAVTKNFHFPLYDYLIDTGHPLAKVAEVVARDGSLGDIDTPQTPEAMLFHRVLNRPGNGRLGLHGPYLFAPLSGDSLHPELGVEGTLGRSSWAVRATRAMHPEKGSGYFVKADFPRHNRWEQIQLSDGPIWHQDTRPHSEAAFLLPDEMESLLHGIHNDSETTSTTKRAVRAYLGRHFKPSTPTELHE